MTEELDTILQSWPEESRGAAKLVIGEYGEPDERTPSELTWHKRGQWKRIVASKVFYDHHFPAPHIDSVECVIDYRVPPEKFSDLAAFDAASSASVPLGKFRRAAMTNRRISWR
jgi:hypothetical protein